MERQESSWSASAFIAYVAWPFRWYLCGMACVMLLWAVDLTLRPYLIKWILNTATQGASDVLLYKLSLLSALFCMTLGIVICGFRVYDWLLMRMEPELRRYIVNALMQYGLKHSHSFYQQNMSGSLTDHVNNVARGISQVLKVVIQRFFVILFAVGIALITMARFHATLAGIMGLWVCLFVIVAIIVVRPARALSDIASEAQSNATGSVTDTFSNMMSVRLFTGEAYEASLLDKIFKKVTEAERNRDWLLLKVQAFHTLSFLVLEIISLTILVRGVSAGWVTPGDFSLVLGINLSLIWVLWGLMQDLTLFIKSFGEISHGLKVLTAPYDMTDAPHAQDLHVTRGEISFEGVSFAYGENSFIFHDISLVIKGGQKVGLVGYSGSGKSTFVNLILRLYDLHAGKILIDGQNIADVTQHSLRGSIALIPQDPSLFHRSLRDNIKYGWQRASEVDVKQAAQYAHADKFIENMPQQYDSLVGERGLMLSGGQRQRIAIARAFLKKAPIIILDEATSALDSVTESYIQDSLTHLMQDKTTLVIAHRLSTLMYMDRILVFHKGTIIEDGTHQELLERKGQYFTLWSTQVHGFLPDHE